MKRKLLRSVLFVGLNLVVLVAVLEISLRFLQFRHEGLRTLLYSSTVRTQYEDIETLEELLSRSAFGFSPGTERFGFVLNSRGFRTKEYSYERTPGAYRIVVLGDSFAFASGRVPYRSMWPVRLEEELTRHTEGDVEVVNLGVAAVGPRFELRVWELEGRLLAPDLVVVAFFVGNDFFEGQRFQLEHTPESDLQRWSYSYRLLRNRWRLHRERWDRDATAAQPGDHPTGGVELEDYEYDPMDATYSEPAYLRIEAKNLQLCKEQHRSDFERLFSEGVAPVLLRLYQGIRQEGAEVVFLIIPDEYQVDAELSAKLLDELSLPDSAVDLERPQRRLGRFFEQHGIRYLDLRPAFVEETRQRRLYRLRDSHWNIEGNDLAARLLADYLLGGEQRSSAGR
jgi:hypothetical protein